MTGLCRRAGKSATEPARLVRNSGIAGMCRLLYGGPAEMLGQFIKALAPCDQRPEDPHGANEALARGTYLIGQLLADHLALPGHGSGCLVRDFYLARDLMCDHRFANNLPLRRAELADRSAAVQTAYEPQRETDRCD